MTLSASDVPGLSQHPSQMSLSGYHLSCLGFTYSSMQLPRIEGIQLASRVQVRVVRNWICTAIIASIVKNLQRMIFTGMQP
jgi:hypothetical protein